MESLVFSYCLTNFYHGIFGVLLMFAKYRYFYYGIFGVLLLFTKYFFRLCSAQPVLWDEWRSPACRSSPSCGEAIFWHSFYLIINTLPSTILLNAKPDITSVPDPQHCCHQPVLFTVSSCQWWSYKLLFETMIMDYGWIQEGKILKIRTKKCKENG